MNKISINIKMQAQNSRSLSSNQRDRIINACKLVSAYIKMLIEFFKNLDKWLVPRIPSNMVKIDALQHQLKAFRRFIITSTCSSFAFQVVIIEDSEVFAERR